MTNGIFCVKVIYQLLVLYDTYLKMFWGVLTDKKFFCVFCNPITKLGLSFKACRENAKLS